MKRLLLLLLFLISLTSISQTYPIYKKAKITYNNLTNFEALKNLGVSLDHGQHKRGVFIISDFSEKEIEAAKSLGMRVDILIEDSTADFLRRNKLAKTQKQVQNPTCVIDDNAVEYTTPANFVLGSMGGYLTYQEMLDNLDAMHAQYPNLISARANISNFVTNGTPDNTVSPSIGGNSIQWVRISDNPDTDETSEPEILYDSIHHAREPASLSQLIYYMWYLLENYATDPDIKNIVDNTELYFVPVVNPDGYLYNQKTNPNGGGFWRKNRFNANGNNGGVDNNRNYDYFINGDSNNGVWGGPGSSNDPNSEIHHGTAPFSEVENQAMKWFVEQHQFIIAMNNHTFGELLYYPHGYADVPTADDDLYVPISAEFTSRNGYSAQRDSPFAGDSDDFMYGTVGTHDKIFAFTPEIGNAFWPASNEIDGICKDMMYLNLTAAKAIRNYASVEDKLGDNVQNIAFNADFTIKRVGFVGSGDFTVSIIPISSNITSVGASKTFNGLIAGQTQDDFITVNLENTIANGNMISYSIQVDSGDFIETITVNKIYDDSSGNSVTIVDNNANDLGAYTNQGWGVTTSTFVSSTGSITDSPSGNYGANENKTIQYTETIDLSDATAADVQYYAKWTIENNWDYTQFEVSTDGGASWTPQCGKHTNIGSSNSGQPTGEPLYDGNQSDWVLEEISLSDYLGQTINIRFQFASDDQVNQDGFYFDDLKVNIISQTLSTNDLSISSFTVHPNPASNTITINTDKKENYTYSISNIQGQQIKSETNVNESRQIDISSYSSGIYFISLNTKDSQKVIKFIKK